MADVRCESRAPGGQPCGATARYRVSRARQLDAQNSCGRHLMATVEALMRADDVPVTVQRIREGGSDSR